MTPDAVARLILDEAALLFGPILVIDDVAAALTTAALASGFEVRAFCDDLTDAEALPGGTRLTSLDDPYVPTVELVLARLPKSLAGLDDLCGALTTDASPTQRLVAGGRVKHMTIGQNDVLGRYYASVRASRGRDKSRVLDASGPTGAAPRWPQSRALPSLGLTVWAHGNVFAGTRLDAGTALLVDALGAGLSAGEGRRALDLGCGSGILATWLAGRGWTVEASDVSHAAVASTRLTAAANDAEVAVVQRDGLRGVPAASLDLIVTNPPFHQGTAKESTPTLEAIASAGAVLREGGEFWCVFNSHLPYLRALAEAVGPTSIVCRDRHYTVTRSRRVA